MTSGSRGVSVRKMLNKVPEVTLYFWVIKVLCTTVGETASGLPIRQRRPRADKDHLHKRLGGLGGGLAQNARTDPRGVLSLCGVLVSHDPS